MELKFMDNKKTIVIVLQELLKTLKLFTTVCKNINKLKPGLLLKLANALRIKMESLLADINLIFDVT